MGLVPCALLVLVVFAVLLETAPIPITLLKAGLGDLVASVASVALGANLVAEVRAAIGWLGG